MSKKDQQHTHHWQRRVKDWLIASHHSTQSPARDISLAELATHNSRNDCWICIQNTVYDVTRFLPYHPGGSRIVEQYGGRDATAAYVRNHSDFGPLEGVANCVIGPLVVGDGVPAPPPPAGAAVKPVGLSSRPAGGSSDAAPQLQRRFSGKGSLSSSTSSQQQAPSSMASSSTAPAGPATSLAPEQIATAAQRSQLFTGLSSEDINTLSRQTAGQMAAEGGVDEDAAVAEVFALLDTENRGLIHRDAFRDFLYKLDPAGCTEEVLLRAPEQITLPVLQKLLKQM